jgi:hypothetical protein
LQYIVTTYNYSMGICYPVNESFFRQWSHPMAYILGFIYADGSLEYSPKIRGKYLRISSTDYRHLHSVRNILESQHTLVKIRKKHNSHRDSWLLRIGNSVLFDSLTTLGLEPNKSLTMVLPNIPQPFLCSFTRGYFDGDGCVQVEKRTNTIGLRIPKRLRIIFTSGSKKFLSCLLANLSNIDSIYRNGKIYTSNINRAYRLVFPTATSISFYTFMYKNTEKNLLLKPKFDKFNEYFDYRKVCYFNKQIEKIRAQSAQW